MNQSPVRFTCTDMATTNKIIRKSGHSFSCKWLFLFAQNLLFCLIIIVMLPKKLDMKWNLCLWCDFILNPIFIQEKSIDKCVKSKWCEKDKKKAITFLICMLPCRIVTNFRKIESVLLKFSAVSLWISKNKTGEIHFASEYSWYSWLLSFKSNLNLLGFTLVFSQW